MIKKKKDPVTVPCEGCREEMPLSRDLIIVSNSRFDDQEYWHSYCRMEYLTEKGQR